MRGREKNEVDNRSYILAYLSSVVSKYFSSIVVCFIVLMEMLKAEIYSYLLFEGSYKNNLKSFLYYK